MLIGRNEALLIPLSECELIAHCKIRIKLKSHIISRFDDSNYSSKYHYCQSHSAEAGLLSYAVYVPLHQHRTKHGEQQNQTFHFLTKISSHAELANFYLFKCTEICFPRCNLSRHNCIWKITTFCEKYHHTVVQDPRKVPDHECHECFRDGPY